MSFPKTFRIPLLQPRENIEESAMTDLENRVCQLMSEKYGISVTTHRRGKRKGSGGQILALAQIIYCDTQQYSVTACLKAFHPITNVYDFCGRKHVSKLKSKEKRNGHLLQQSERGAAGIGALCRKGKKHEGTYTLANDYANIGQRGWKPGSNEKHQFWR